MGGSLFTAFIAHALFVFASLHPTSSCKYEKFTPEHTMCKDPSNTCQVTKSEVSEEDKKLILNVHNKYRSKVAMGQEKRAGGLPTAANMMEMTWDDELAQVAQRHAEQCKFQHDCNKCRQVERFSVGQNIQSGSSTSEYKDAGWENMVTKFYEEVKYFDKDFISPFKSSPQTNTYGHFSQVVWAKTSKVGCGWVMHEKDRGSFKYKLLVCNYGPAGNMIGGDMYKVGKPCSTCPKGSSCGDSAKLQGLCKSDGTSTGTTEIETREERSSDSETEFADEEGFGVFHWKY